MDTAIPHVGRYWHLRDDGKLQCDLCPRDCALKDGQRGACFVRQRVGDEMHLTTYGRSSGFCIDPIEKKPLNHFYPGSSVFSFGTAGCNLACKFCQNWDISKSRDFDRLCDQASPQQIAAKAVEMKCRSVAFTYNDPVIFAEYAMDVADACHERGVATVAVTAGYIHSEPRAEFFAKMDAANVDLKGFSQEFYKKLCAAEFKPILETIEYIHRETNCWMELTTLVIPGWNDSTEELARLSEWVAEKLGPNVPLHFSAFHPDFRMMDVPPTSPETLRRARRIALNAGLNYVYVGNVHDPQADSTYCPACGVRAIRRDWYEISDYRLTETGECGACGKPISGRFEMFKRPFGSRRIPVVMAMQENVVH